MKFSIVHLACPIAFLDCGAIIEGIDIIITIQTMKKLLFTLFILSVVGLVGCGKTGPLYMPDDAQKNEQTSK